MSEMGFFSDVFRAVALTLFAIAAVWFAVLLTRSDFSFFSREQGTGWSHTYTAPPPLSKKDQARAHDAALKADEWAQSTENIAALEHDLKTVGKRQGRTSPASSILRFLEGSLRRQSSWILSST